MSKAYAALAVACALALAGCSGIKSNEEAGYGPTAEYGAFGKMPNGAERFTVEGTDMSYVYVLIDHLTGVQYLVYDGYQESWAVPLLDADGTPLLTAEAGE